MNLDTLLKAGACSVAGIAITGGGAAGAAAVSLLGTAAVAMVNSSSSPLTLSTSLPWLNPSPTSPTPNPSITSNRQLGRVRREAPTQPKAKAKGTCQNEKTVCNIQKKSAESNLSTCLGEKLILEASNLKLKNEESKLKANAERYGKVALDSQAAAEAAKNETVKMSVIKTTAQSDLQICKTTRDTLKSDVEIAKNATTTCKALSVVKDAQIVLAQKGEQAAKDGVTNHCFLMQKGDTGKQGLPGQPGQKGSQGQKGDTGMAGPPGSSGAPGANGRDGPVGPQGDTGPPGTVEYSTLFPTSIGIGSLLALLLGPLIGVVIAMKSYTSMTGLNRRQIEKYQTDGVRAEALRQESDRLKLMSANQSLNEQITFASKMQELSRLQILKLEQSTREAEKITAEAKKELVLQNLLHLKDQARLESLDGLIEQQNALLSMTMEKMQSNDAKVIRMSPVEKAALILTRTQAELDRKTEEYLRKATGNDLHALQTSAKSLKR